MSVRILLVRHGRSAHVHTGWIDAAGFQEWMNAYDAAGIAASNSPPPLLQEAVARAKVLVCSDLRRARASAGALAPERSWIVSSLLRESKLSVPPGIRCKLPLLGWAFAISCYWIYSKFCGKGLPAVEQRRALEAAEWLEQIAFREGDVIAVTHASFRSVVAGALASRGWRCEVRWRRYHHWSTWSFVKETI